MVHLIAGKGGARKLRASLSDGVNFLSAFRGTHYPEEFTPLPTCAPRRQRGQMLLEGRKQPRTPERFLVQLVAVHDPLLIGLATVQNLSSNGAGLATERSWELGSQVDVEAIAGKLRARARVVYCKTVGFKKYVVGLNLITRDDGRAKPSTK